MTRRQAVLAWAVVAVVGIGVLALVPGCGVGSVQVFSDEGTVVRVNLLAVALLVWVVGPGTCFLVGRARRTRRRAP